MSPLLHRCRHAVPILLIWCSGALAAQTNTVASSGAVSAANTTTTVAGTIGQPVIGTVATSPASLDQGFWAASPAARSTASAVAGDGTTLGLSCAPNPTGGIARVTVNSTSIQPLSLSLHDMLGREVRAMLIDERTGASHVIDLDAKGLAAGQYRLVLTSGSNQTVLPLTVVR